MKICEDFVDKILLTDFELNFELNLEKNTTEKLTFFELTFTKNKKEFSIFDIISFSNFEVKIKYKNKD